MTFELFSLSEHPRLVWRYNALLLSHVPYYYIYATPDQHALAVCTPTPRGTKATILIQLPRIPTAATARTADATARIVTQFWLSARVVAGQFISQLRRHTAGVWTSLGTPRSAEFNPAAWPTARARRSRRSRLFGVE